MEPSTKTYAVRLLNLRGEQLPGPTVEQRAGKLAVGLPFAYMDQRYTIVDVRETGPATIDVTVEPAREAEVRRPRLRFVIGPRPDVASNFTVLHGDRDVTELFDVKRLQLDIDANAKRPQLTVVRLELYAEVDVFGEVDLACEDVTPAGIEEYIRGIASESHVLELPAATEGIEKLSRRHLVELARRHRTAVLLARRMLMPVPVELCARCSLPEGVHGHGETGREDSHPFEPSPALAIARAGGAERIDVVQLDEHGTACAGLDNCLAPSDVKLEPGETLMVWEGEPPLVISSVEPASEGRRKRVYVHRGDTKHPLIAEVRDKKLPLANQGALGADPRERIIDALKAGGAREVTP